ncbi:hypothetical protein PG990_001592 [Apiospora arundinis]
MFSSQLTRTFPPEAATKSVQVVVSTTQIPNSTSEIVASTVPPPVKAISGTFGTSTATATAGSDTGTTSTRTDSSSMILQTDRTTSTPGTRSDAPRTSATSTAAEAKGAASLFEVSRGTRISTNMVAISVFTTLTIIRTAQSCTMSV